MRIRPLIIDAVARAKIAHLIEHAEGHHYHVGVDPIPGDDPAFVIHLDTYRVVFTFTEDHGQLWRHLSISVPAPEKYPHPAATFTIAQEFGFAGWDGATLDRMPHGWHLKIEREPPLHIVLAQKVADDDRSQAAD
jgi:hypothetical protein